MGYTVIFKKLRQRKSLEFTSLTTAVSKNKEGHLIIAMAGVDPGPVVVRAKVDEDKEKLIAQAVRKSRAIDNDMLTRTYRRQLIHTFLSTSFSALKI
jgi:CO/xanthine dehydrogenase FAD-binding subunit